MKARLFTLALAIAATALTAHAESIPIDEAHFPDAAFRNYVLTEMKYHKSDGTWALVGTDGQLSDYERKRVAWIYLPDGCQSAEGIQYFAKSETGTWGLDIYVKSDDLKTLDLSGMDVTTVNAANHKLVTLNLAGCTKLTSVECPMNTLTTLNVEGCTKLESLMCYENQITALNVAQMLELRYLDCHENQLTGLNITSPALQKIDCSQNPLEWLFLPNTDYGATMLDCSDTQLSSLDLRDNRYNHVDCSNSPILGIEWSSAGNGYVVGLNCSNTKILPEDILAIPNPDKVKDLSCAGCGLTTLDLSKLTSLYWVDCGDNLLTTLDVSHNTVLRGCFVNNNQLFALDVSGTSCTSLSNCWQHIEAQAVEMDGKTYVRLNSEVDVTKISDLKVRRNGLLYTSISNPTMRGEYLLVDEDGASDVSVVEYKYDVGNELKMNVRITTGGYGVAINEYNFPDQLFRNVLLSKDYGQDALLTQNEIAAITELDVQGKNIATVEGIQYLRNLTYLNVSNNNLTDAGFSDLMAYLPNLTELYFDDNESITRFDAGQNTKLRKLSCWGCALTSLDVRGLTALQELGCDDNRLTFLNLSENTKLRRLQCSDNQLTEIYGLDSLTELRNLVCSNNQIATLDVSTFPMLAELQCGGNSLTTLDLRQNGNLRYLYVEKNQLSTLLLPENAPLKWLRIYGNQLKNDAMRAIVELLPTLATTYNVRAYYEGLSTEGNELSPAVVSAMRAKNWNPQYTTTGSSWQDYAGGTVTYGLKLCGKQVTSDNAADLTAISGVTGFCVQFDELTNTLTLIDAAITSSTSVGLDNSIDGLTIAVTGNNTFNITGFNGLYLRKKTTITGTGTLAAISNKNGIYIYADTLFVKGGATVSGASTGTTGYGILGRKTARQGIDGSEVYTYYGSLVISGDETKVQGLGATASIGQLKSLTMPTSSTIKVTDNSGVNPRQVNGYFYDHSVCTRSGSSALNYTYTPATSLVVITTPTVGLAINATNFPDEAFRSYLLAQSYGADAIITDDELENISVLPLSNQGIADLTGVTHFFALEKLYVIGNQLTTANLSGLTYLQNVDIMDNQLTEEGITALISSLPEADGSQNAILIYHEGSDNEGNVEPTDAQIMAAWQKGWTLAYQKADGSFGWYERPGVTIDATHFPDAAFRNYVATNCDPDGDGFLDYDELHAVTHLNLFNKDIANLQGIEYFTELTWLDCSYNRLTQLTLTENCNLVTLFCQYNQLTQLIVKNCPSLCFLYCHDNQLNYGAMKNMMAALPSRAELEVNGNLCVVHEGSETEGNTITSARVAYLKEQKNWTSYYTTDCADWHEFVSGDVNGDGSVTIADVTALVNIILGKSAAPTRGVADVNSDYSVTIADVTALVNIILGK